MVHNKKIIVDYHISQVCVIYVSYLPGGCAPYPRRSKPAKNDLRRRFEGGRTDFYDGF